MAKNSVKQKSIAEELNLSVATVSKALSDYSDINAKTRAKSNQHGLEDGLQI